MAIEKAPSKNWELTLYEMQRTPQPLITDDSEIAICPLRLSNELKCPICLDFLNNTMATKECLHRFCSQCIVTALRSGNKECPACRKKLVSKRSLRHDPNFDAVIAKLFPYRKEYEAHQATVMAKQIKQSLKSTKVDNEPSNKKVDNEQQECGTNQSWSNNEAESGSSKEQSSTTSVYPPKYRNAMKYIERTSLSLQTDNAEVLQVEEDNGSTVEVETVIPQKRMRHASSESGDPETNCSSSITSELCSIVGNQSRDGDSQSNIAVSDKPQLYTFSENPIDIVLEPLDGRTSKTKLNESFILQIPEVTTAGHLVEFLNIRRNEMHKVRRPNIDNESFNKGLKTRHIIDEVTYNIYLGMTSNEKKVNTATTDPNRQGTSAGLKTVRKSMNTKLELSDKLNNVINEFTVRKKKNKKEKIKQPLNASHEFLVFYYQEVSLKNMNYAVDVLN